MGNVRPAPAILRDHLHGLSEELVVGLPPKVADFLTRQEMIPAAVVSLFLEAGQNILAKNCGDDVLDLRAKKGLPGGQVFFFLEEGPGS